MQQPHYVYDMATNNTTSFYHQLTLDAYNNSSSTLSPNQYHLQHKHRHTQHSYQFQEQPHYLAPQPQEDSTPTVSFWKAFNTVLSDAAGKNENFGELEAVYINASNRKETAQTHNTCINVANEGQMLETDTNGARRKGRKRRRKKKAEEEMGSFFKRLVKRVIKHQEVLQNKFLEAIERMEKERAEWEQGWRLREREIHDREAIVKARERDLASKRDSSIVSTLEKITGQSFVLLSSSGKTSHDQLSTIHEN